MKIEIHVKTDDGQARTYNADGMIVIYHDPEDKRAGVAMCGELDYIEMMTALAKTFAEYSKKALLQAALAFTLECAAIGRGKTETEHPASEENQQIH